LKPDSDESGFTLIELLLVVALLGAVVIPIAAAIIVGLKSTNATANRIESSHDAQMVALYLPADLQSVTNDAAIVSTPSVTPACAGVPSANVLQLSWSQQVSPTASDEFRAQYVVAFNDSAQNWQLTRYYCARGLLQQSTVLARNLAGANAVVVNSARLPQLTLSITSKTAPNDAPYTFSVSGTRRTPSES
jgi:type II secretory pathway pseudopilin PulG